MNRAMQLRLVKSDKDEAILPDDAQGSIVHLDGWRRVLHHVLR